MGYLWVIYGKTYNKQRNKIGANVVHRGLMRINPAGYSQPESSGLYKEARCFII